MPKSFILLLFALLLFNADVLSQGTTIFSRNQGISVGQGGVLYYCDSDPIDSIYNISPGNQDFSGTGINDPVLNDGWAYFDPSAAGIGTHTISYSSKNYFFTVTAPATALLDPFSPDAYCETDAHFALTGGSSVPAGDPTGRYLINGVEGIEFWPDTLGAGTHTIQYVVGTGTCISYSAPQFITVYETPIVSFSISPAINADLCIDDVAITLAGGSPLSGGSGTGVYKRNNTVVTTFDPAAVGAGIYTFWYVYTNIAGCSDSASATITVHSLPLVSISDLKAEQCDTASAYTITGNPNDAGGIFYGSGITDNAADGTASFDPGSAVLGFQDIIYHYTDAFGCVNADTQQTRVGTLIAITGLDPVYCASDAPITFNYTPYLPFHDSTKIYTNGLAGSLTDLGGGVAEFDPLAAGPTTDLITYEFWDEIGCENIISQPVEVAATPSANFSGLNASLEYCKGAANVTLTGNYAPLGTFTGPVGALVDNGDGTATFSPAALPVGGPYTITYTYTNTSNCSDTESKDVTILTAPTATLSGSATICAGTSTDLTVTLTGTPNYNISYTDGFSNLQPLELLLLPIPFQLPLPLHVPIPSAAYRTQPMPVPLLAQAAPPLRLLPRYR